MSKAEAALADLKKELERQLDSRVQRLREAMHRRFLELVDLPALRPEDLESKEFRQHATMLVDNILDELRDHIPPITDRDEQKKHFLAEALGLGALEPLLADESVSEIMVLNRETVFIERGGKLMRAPVCFGSEAALRSIIERIIMPLGRRVDESQPLVDARLKTQGSRVNTRVNIIIPPLAISGQTVTIRKFSKNPLSLESLCAKSPQSLDERMKRFLIRCVQARKNIVVSGGTGSGKTTLLNALSQFIDPEERIITIEDAAEIQLHDKPHWVQLETRPPNFEGQGAFTIRDLVKNTLRMRPDRIIVGECRGGEALDMLQAMNTGHDGSLTTLHANNPEEALSRLETLCLMAGVELPAKAIRSQIANAVHIIVQQSRFADGSRRITDISEVIGMDDDGEILLHPLFLFERQAAEIGAEVHAQVTGRFRATGYVPTFIAEFYAQGLINPGEAF